MSTFGPNTLEIIEEFLEKARRRLSDENPDYADRDEEETLEEEPEYSDEEDDADRWLASHGTEDEEVPPEEELTEDAPEQAEQEELVPEVKAPPARPVMIRRAGAAPAQQSVTPAPAAPEEDEDAMQPTREEIARLREYTRPWSSRASDKTHLEAEAHVNPVKHHQGRLIEARNLSHKDWHAAHRGLLDSPDYKNADDFTRMEMEDQFKRDWHAKNPDHLRNVFAATNEAHDKGRQAMQIYNKAKDDKLRHIAGGGAQPDAMSLEEGMQHAGGSRDDEDSGPSGIQQDKAAQFAAGNQDFVQQYMKGYDSKKRSFADVPDEYAPQETRANVEDVLGEHPTLKDPAKKRVVDQFIARYHPMIDRIGRHVVSKLGLGDKVARGEIDMESVGQEAGMHAIFQAINDYDHDHPSKAKFTTHLSNKMRGLMQTALKQQDAIPAALRAGAKKFDTKARAATASPVKHTNKEGVTTIINPAPAAPPKPEVQAPPAASPVAPPAAPKAPVVRRPAAQIAQAVHPDVHDRLKRIAAVKAGTAAPRPKMTNVRFTTEEGEE